MSSESDNQGTKEEGKREVSVGYLLPKDYQLMGDTIYIGVSQGEGHLPRIFARAISGETFNYTSGENGSFETKDCSNRHGGINLREFIEMILKENNGYRRDPDRFFEEGLRGFEFIRRMNSDSEKLGNF